MPLNNVFRARSALLERAEAALERQLPKPRREIPTPDRVWVCAGPPADTRSIPFHVRLLIRFHIVCSVK
jgi:hypothetical protein